MSKAMYKMVFNYLNIMANQCCSCSDMAQTCGSCLQSLFPFNHLENDSDFLACVNNTTSNAPQMLNIDDLNDRIFLPFNCDESFVNSHISDIDPDVQYFNKFSHNITNCDYYNENSFNLNYKKKSCSLDNFSIIHMNIRSAAKNLKQFEVYLDQLDACFNVIGLSETWLTDSNVDLYNLQGYSSCHVYRSNKRGGGVSVHVKDSIHFQSRNDLDVSDNILEGVFVELDKKDVGYDKNVIVGVMYRPPGSDLEQFIEKSS